MLEKFQKIRPLLPGTSILSTRYSVLLGTGYCSSVHPRHHQVITNMVAGLCYKRTARTVQAVCCEPVPVGFFFWQTQRIFSVQLVQWFMQLMCFFVFFTNYRWFVACSLLFNGLQEVHRSFVMQIILKNSLQAVRKPFVSRVYLPLHDTVHNSVTLRFEHIYLIKQAGTISYSQPWSPDWHSHTILCGRSCNLTPSWWQSAWRS